MAGLGNFAGGLASGLAAGMRLADNAEEQKWNNEQRGRQRKQWEDEDAVGKSLGASIAGEQPAPNDVGLSMMGQKVGASSVDAGQSIQTPAAPVASPDPAMANMAPGLDSVSGAGAAQPTQAAKQPGLSDTPDTTKELKRYLKASEAAMKTAAERGNFHLYTTHFKQGAEIRDKLRTDALARAEQQFAVTGDYNAFLPAYNDYVADGNKVEAITKQADGTYVVKASVNGETVERPVGDEAAMKKLVGTMIDPAAMRKLEAAQALKDYEFSAKSKEAIALEKVKGDERVRLEEVRTKGRINVRQTVPGGSSGGGGGSKGGGLGDASKGAKFDVDQDGNRVILYRNGTMVYPKDDNGNQVKIKAGTDQDQKFQRDLVKTFAGKSIVPPEDPVAEAAKLTEATKPKSAASAPSIPAGIPEGSKQIGTSGGKPVFESPDGKRFIVK